MDLSVTYRRIAAGFLETVIKDINYLKVFLGRRVYLPLRDNILEFPRTIHNHRGLLLYKYIIDPKISVFQFYTPVFQDLEFNSEIFSALTNTTINTDIYGIYVYLRNAIRVAY